jgi:hypothetical protein
MTGSATHCGVCIPCIIRRIAIESHGLEVTKYERNLFQEAFANLPQEDDGRRNLADFGEFNLRFEKNSEMDLMMEWPELYSPEIAASEVIQVYKRAATEARKVLGAMEGVGNSLSIGTMFLLEQNP